MKKKRYIEILGTNAKNRGAELMAIAIKQRFNKQFPHVELVVDSRFGTYLNRAKHGFYVTNHNSGSASKQLMRALIFNNLPNQVAKTLGVVKNRQISAVLDATGFGYSDQWGGAHPRKIVDKMNSKAYQGSPLILLPQALGKFEKPAVAQHCKTLFERAHTVYARDTMSHQYVEDLKGEISLKQCPDFTVGVSPDLSRNEELPAQFAALVPNARMLDKTEQAGSYVEFMKTCVEKIKASGLEPIFILHDSKEDQTVISQIDPKGDLKIFTDEDPCILKGMLGKADYVIGSRFHALVSSLSQGVLCIGAGWSHKYPELFSDFAVKDYIVSDFTDQASIDAVFTRLSNTAVRAQDQADLLQAVASVKGQVELMWGDVEAALGL